MIFRYKYIAGQHLVKMRKRPEDIPKEEGRVRAIEWLDERTYSTEDEARSAAQQLTEANAASFPE